MQNEKQGVKIGIDLTDPGDLSNLFPINFQSMKITFDLDNYIFAINIICIKTFYA